MGGMTVDRPLPAGDLEGVVQLGDDIWNDLRGETLLITGATGFFGRWMMESLLAANYRHRLGVSIVALSRNPDAFLARAPHLASQPLRWVTGSVTSLSPEAIGGNGLDTVIHLATEADMKVAKDNPQAAADVIVEGTRRVLHTAARLGARRFLFTSSGAAYGSQPGDLPELHETHEGIPDPTDAANPYARQGLAKRHAEIMVEEHGRIGGMSAVIARCFTFAGPALPLDSKFAFGNFLRDALDGRSVVVRGDGTAVRSYLYAADLALWLWTLLLRGKSSRRYNVGSENAVSIRELAELIALEAGNGQVDVRVAAPEGRLPERYVPSTMRSRDELGLREHYALREMVRNTAAWHRSNRKH